MIAFMFRIEFIVCNAGDIDKNTLINGFLGHPISALKFSVIGFIRNNCFPISVMVRLIFLTHSPQCHFLSISVTVKELLVIQ